MWARPDVCRFVAGVEALDEHRAQTVEITACSRCGGAGGAQKWEHTGYTCFECGGSGLGKERLVKLYSAERLARLDAAGEKARATRERKRAEQARQAAAEREAMKEQTLADAEQQFPEAMAVLRALEGESDEDMPEGTWFLLRIREGLFEGGRPLTEGQAEAVLRIDTIQRERAQWQQKIAEIQARGERPEPGRQQLDGYVLAVKDKLQDRGVPTIVHKMLLLDTRGFKAWMTVPRELLDAIPRDEYGDRNPWWLRHKRVQMNATLSPKEDDFAFASRPAKAVLVHDAPQVSGEEFSP